MAQFLATSSRGAMLGVIVFLLLFFCYKYCTKYYRSICTVFISGLYFYPFILLFFDSLIPKALKVKAIQLIGTRYFHHCAYTQMGIEKLLGVGYFNGVKFCRPYIDKYLPFMGNFHPEYNQQHGIFFQILSEFGILGYLIWGLFLIKLLKKINGKYHIIGAISVAMFASFSLLNSLNEIAFYFLLALIWANSSREDFDFL